MPPGTQNTSANQTVRAPRGAALSCKGWQQEAALRLLLNSLDPEVAERPQELFISGAAGRAAADWDSVNAIVASLRQIESNESLMIESGKPAGVSHTTPRSTRVIVTSAGARGEKFGDWLYVGTQTELPALYEIYAEAARSHFGGTLAGKLVVGAGMGGAGGAQPLAAALHGAAFLGIDADAERIKRRVKGGYCEVMVNHLDEALRMLKNAVRQRKSVSIGLIGNCAELFPELARRGIVPDLLTDYTPAQAQVPFAGYIPASPQDGAAEAGRAESIAAHILGLRELEKLGTRVINSSNAIDYLRLLFDEGRRLTTWLALSGEPGDIARIDRLALETFADDASIQRWLPIAARYVRFQGLPARVAWLKERDIAKFGRAANDLVARAEISAPILLGCRVPPPDSPAADVAAAETGSCWTWRSNAAAAVAARDLHQFPAHAIVADGTADAAKHLSHWTGA